MNENDYEYRPLIRNGKCCSCGRKIFANKDYVIHGYNHKSNAGTVTLCTFCITNMNRLIDEFQRDKKEDYWINI